VVESFRNELLSSYKTGEGIHHDLFAQFSLAEEAVSALGIVVWPMVEFEADDALATAAHCFQQDPRVGQVIICSPDKDLAQFVVQDRIVCWDRRRDIVYDEAAVIEKFGVAPVSIPDWLALVGDNADGVPGIPTWGAKSSSTVLARYGHLEAIPDRVEEWNVPVRGARRLLENLVAHREQAFLYRRLTRLRTDVPLTESLDDLRWKGPQDDFEQICQELGASDLLTRLPQQG
jgi:5'-3' exonuclease